MTKLVPSVVPLVHGLDLTSPKIVAPPGSLVDCLNYELVDFVGYKRIDGYERYDARISPAITKFYQVSTLDSVAAYSPGDILGTSEWFKILGGGGSTPKSTREYLGVVLATYTSVDTITNNIVFALFNYGDAITNANITSVARLNTATETLVNTVTVTGITEGTDTATAGSAAYVTQLLAYQEVLRSFITTLPTVAIGLHWLDDQLYAVAGARVLRFESIGIGVYYYPTVGTAITGSGGSTGIILAAEIEGDGGSSPNVQLTIFDYGTGGWIGETVAGVYEDSGFGTTLLAVESLTGDSSISHLWTCRDQLTTINSDSPPLTFGWEPIFHGWTFNFTDGNVAAGFFNKKERNQDNLAPTTYYFSDGATVFSGQILTYFVSSGDLTTGDAAGVMQVGALTTVSGTGTLIGAAYSIYSDLALTVLVGEASSTMEYNSLPGIEDITDAGTRYEFITANFYADQSLTAMYGVNGVDYAFYYDRTNFYKIHTGATTDRPRHLANHLEHLALGYSAGSVLLSVVGEPWNFNATDGASEIAIGEVVTGLCTLNGNTLAVFCDQSVWAISGSTVDSFNLQVLVPNVGCIEYSLAIIGQPVFCTNWGISTLEQSEKYGDFVGNRLSQPINPWLLDKIVDKRSGRSSSAGVLCAVPVRSKNQYKLFLKDGNIVTMTLGGEQPPSFTFQQWQWPTDDAKLVKPIATSSQVDQYGKERIHFSTWDEDEGTLAYVFEAETGWSFDGNVIPAYFDTNWYFAGNDVATFQTVAGVRLHGLIQGYASLNVYASGVECEYDSSFSTQSQPISLDRNYTTKVFDEYQPATNIVDLAKRGLGIQFRFESSATTPEPPHVCQVLTVLMRADGSRDS